MLFTHPDRTHKPLRPRTSRVDRRNPANAGDPGGGGGLGGTSVVGGHGYFHVGGNAFLPGGGNTGVGMGNSQYDGEHVCGDSSKPGVYDAVGCCGGGGGAGEGDMTLVDPGKASLYQELRRGGHGFWRGG